MFYKDIVQAAVNRFQTVICIRIRLVRVNHFNRFGDHCLGQGHFIHLFEPLFWVVGQCGKIGAIDFRDHCHRCQEGCEAGGGGGGGGVVVEEGYDVVVGG